MEQKYEITVTEEHLTKSLELVDERRAKVRAGKPYNEVLEYCSVCLMATAINSVVPDAKVTMGFNTFGLHKNGREYLYQFNESVTSNSAELVCNFDHASRGETEYLNRLRALLPVTLTAVQYAIDKYDLL